MKAQVPAPQVLPLNSYGQPQGNKPSQRNRCTLTRPHHQAPAATAAPTATTATTSLRKDCLRRLDLQTTPWQGSGCVTIATQAVNNVKTFSFAKDKPGSLNHHHSQPASPSLTATHHSQRQQPSQPAIPRNRDHNRDHSASSNRDCKRERKRDCDPQRDSTATTQSSHGRRLIETPSPPRVPHVEAVTVGLSCVFSVATASAADAANTSFSAGYAHCDATEPPIHGHEAQEGSATSSTPSSPVGGLSVDSSRFHFRGGSGDSARDEVHPVVRISKQTHNAVLYALEEALRHPRQFSRVVEEEEALMADLLHGRGSSGAAPSASHTNMAAGALSPPHSGASAGIRGPRIIMRERQEREARRAEQERQHRADDARRNDRQTHLAAGAANTQTGGVPADRRQQVSTSNPRQPSGSNNAPLSAAGLAPPQATATRQSRNMSASAPTPNVGVEPAYAPQQPQRPALETPRPGTTVGRSSFPHAFERWEALSAHWEGLTSFWIRKLEQNASEIERDPVSTQLARQVTDLSAAGANLFHAVVELQRLRASSERKFQRWFFETRAEIERLGETNGLLQQTLEQERAGQDTRIKTALQSERDSSKIQVQLAEMKKELAISKEEARRAWDELGRREQEERDRVQHLQAGLPVIIGGVQVVPMTNGMSQQQSTGHGDVGDAPSLPPGHATPAAAAAATANAARPVEVYSQYPQPHAGGPSTTSNNATSAGTRYYTQATPRSEASYSEDGSEDLAAYAPAVSGVATTPFATPMEYAGEGFGTWDATRHHHPTRLSDVPEEDERSRTSALSRAM